MKTLHKGLMPMLSLFLSTIYLQAQDITGPVISGSIMTERGYFLEGVTVQVAETNGESIFHTTTKEKGTFQFIGLKVGSFYDFTFSIVGYTDKQLRAFKVREGNGNSLLIRLKESGESLHEVVVIGYGTQNKKDVTTSIESLNAADINNYPATGLDKALTGKLAGVQVLQPAGAPGAGISIMIRGRGTITAGNDPLYIIDGVPISDNSGNGPNIKTNPLNALNINDIESVDVLKDASATAIYGSRGANGVIVITTKRGKKNKPSVSFNSYYGSQEANKKIPMLDSYQYAQLIYDAHNNTYFDLLEDKNLTGSASDDNAIRLAKLLGATGNTSQAYLLPPEIFPYLNKQPDLPNTNWQDEIFRKAPQQDHSLSVSGGSDHIRYYVSGNYMDQRGIVLNSGYKKYGGRLNLDAVYAKLKMGVNLNYNYALYDHQKTEGRFNGNLENVISGALVASPFFSVYKPDGSFNFDQFKWQYAQAQAINPVALALLKTDNMNERKLLTNIFAEYELIKDLKYRISFGADIYNASRNAFRPSTLPNTITMVTPSIPSGNYRNAQSINWVVENTLSYNKNMGKHTLKAIVGFTAQREKSEISSIDATGFSNDLVKTMNAATVFTNGLSGIKEWSLLSTLARVQYSFKERYLLSAAMRADGSSRFGPQKKWGCFPSVSVGWNVSDESFMLNIPLISSLKLRASYGQTGNFQISNYGYLATIEESDYIFGPQYGTALSPGLYQNTIANKHLGWEKTTAVNVGADIAFFNGQLNAAIDIYNNNTNDLLLNVPVPQSTGFSTNLVNIGKVNNKGIEVTLSNSSQFGKFKLTTSVNYSRNKNKVIELGGMNSIITQAQNVIYFITQVGQSIGNYYTLINTGIYKDQAEIDGEKNEKVPGAKPGDFKYKDINGDRVIDGSNDRAITGNYMPKFTYGFSTRLQYRTLDLSGALQGIYGNTIANVNKRHIDATESYANNTINALGRWRSPADPGNGAISRANRSQRGLNATISTYHLEDGSYLRIRDLTVGFTLPARYLSSAKIDAIRIYFTALNPFTFTSYSSYNPEVSIDDNALAPGIDYGSYPLSRAYLFGININL